MKRIVTIAATLSGILLSAQEVATSSSDSTRTKQIDEVVLIGYGTKKKSDVTGSVSSVKSSQIMDRPSVNLEQALAGKLPGVNISTNSGMPGGRTSIAIRGYSSINATNNPLYIVDGIEFTDGIESLNPNEVESVDVLKDASATAIYGTRGSNGVIIITTKKGNTGSIKVNYNGYIALNQLPPARKQEVLTAREWLDLEEVRYKNAAYYDPTGFQNGKYEDPVIKRRRYLVGNTEGNRELFVLDAAGIPQPIYDIDWSDEVFRKSITNAHNLSFTGGRNKTNYGLFLGYADEQGIIRESFQKRYNIRGTLDAEVNKWLNVGGSLAFVRKDTGGVDDSNGSYNVIRNIIEFVPFIPYKYSDGTFGFGGDYEGLEQLDNPLAETTENLILSKSYSFNGNVYTRIKLIKGLEFTSTLGGNFTNNINPRFNSSKLQGGKRINSASIGSNASDFWMWSNRLNYVKTIGNGELDAVLGTEYQKYNQMNWNAATREISDDYYDYFNLGAGAKPDAPSSSFRDYKMASYFGRVNYNLLNKYLFTVTGRFDGSSKFGENNKFAFFPSAAFAWKVSEEEFLKDNSSISNLKFRLSYGLTGNSGIPAYRSLATLGTNSYIIGNSRITGTSISRLANPDLKWEKTAQYNAGIDLGLFDKRLNLVLDFYYKITNNILLDAPVPSTTGFQTVMKNVGKMENKGIDLGVDWYNIKNSTFSWNTNFNFSYLKNRVTQLGDNNEDIIYGFKDNQILRVGSSVGSIFGYIRDGIYSTDQADIASKYKRKPGDVIIRDVNNDGIINSNDRVIIGKGIPDFFGSFVNSFTLKNWYAIVELQFQYGNDIFNNSRNSGEGRFGIANNYATVLDSWTPNNQDAVLEQIRPSGYSYYMDTRKLSDGSFIRGKNLAFGYNFPAEISSKLRVSSLKAYASVQNFFLITNYFGYDPELNNYGTVFSQGITYTNYPKPMTYLFGLNITL